MGKVAVVGGGAAGMMAAVSAAECGHEVHLFEQNEKLGKKLFITGKGRCNLTNGADMQEIQKNIVTNGKFLYSAFYTMTNDDVVSLFHNAGVRTKVERGNRIFPVSDKSQDVISGLTSLLKKNHVQVHLNTKVSRICTNEKRTGENGGNGENGGKKSEVEGILLHKGEKLPFSSVIIATGGFSYQSTGSTGDGYQFARDTGHHVTEILPALVPLVAKEEYVKDLQGLSLKNIQADFFSGGKKFYSDFGEMLFTHFGVSGPVILSASSLITRRLKKGEEIELRIDLKPAIDERVLDERMQREFQEFINKDFRNSLNKVLPKSLIPVIIGLSGIDEYKKVHNITKEERKRLVRIIKGLKLTITATRGFNEAIITQGGVDVLDVNPATMESKLVKGLFFAGEVLDVDAFTGGFNLQIAWSTGRLAGFCAV